ncbi:MAG: DsbA family protein [Halieaceae bacterium]
MSEQFKEQGGAATMDPSRLMRWLTSRVMTRLSRTASTEARHAKAEQERIKAGAPRRVEYFHQVDEAYSDLTAQILERLAQRYDIELHCHLVRGQEGKNAPEPEMLASLARYESHLIAPGYGLCFPEHPDPPEPEHVVVATQILAAQSSEDFPRVVAAVSAALWRGDDAALNRLAAAHGSASADAAAAAVAAGTAKRKALRHYSGAMFHYGGEWYWGVDRLYHLEMRLAALGADRSPGESLIAPRPDMDLAGHTDQGRYTLELYASLRSPYTAVIFDRAVAFAQQAGVELKLRPVLPMVMRGVPATREKGMYIFMDAAREARVAGVPYGNFYDPIGDPARRCYALFPWAASQGKGVELCSSFLRHAFALGVNTNNDRGLRRVVEAAGLDWGAAQAHREDTTWEALLEDNRQTMYAAGLWGVPSFRLLNPAGESLLATWGQDRLWLVAHTLRDALQQENT